jgi:methylaspartate ammonia-lyase
MPDNLDVIATHVRIGSRGTYPVHRLVATLDAGDGRHYRTTCHVDLYVTSGALLTTRPLTCPRCIRHVDLREEAATRARD